MIIFMLLFNPREWSKYLYMWVPMTKDVIFHCAQEIFVASAHLKPFKSFLIERYGHSTLLTGGGNFLLLKSIIF